MARNTSARTQLFQLNIHKQPWEIFSGTTRNLILKIIHLKSSWFLACKFPFKWILFNTLVFKHSSPSFALDGASISPHTKSIIHQQDVGTHMPEERNQQTFTGILKPGAAGGLGKRTPVCCVGKHFKLFRFAWLDHRGDTRSTESETRKAGKMGGGPGRQQRVHLGIWRHCGETVSGSTDMRRVFSAYMVFPKESFSFLKSDFKLYFVLGYSWLTMLW